MAYAFLQDKKIPISNIFCIGRNYTEHIKELNHQLDNEVPVFMKPTSSILQADGIIELPDFSQNIHYECELLILIGTTPEAKQTKIPLECIAGYGIGLDLTARDIQDELRKKGLPWLKAKGFHQSACISSFISANKLPPANDIHFTLHINNELRQQGHTAQMIYPIDSLLSHLHHLYGLQAGDVIFTGTPAGVGKLHTKDQLQLDLNGLLQAQFQVA